MHPISTNSDFHKGFWQSGRSFQTCIDSSLAVPVKVGRQSGRSRQSRSAVWPFPPKSRSRSLAVPTKVARQSGRPLAPCGSILFGGQCGLCVSRGSPRVLSGPSRVLSGPSRVPCSLSGLSWVPLGSLLGPTRDISGPSLIPAGPHLSLSPTPMPRGLSRALSRDLVTRAPRRSQSFASIAHSRASRSTLECGHNLVTTRRTTRLRG